MKRIIVLVLNILLLALFGVILKAIIKGKMALYWSYFIEYGNYYSLQLDFVLFLIVSLFFSLIHKLLFRVCFKNVSISIQALMTGFIGGLGVYLFSAFFNGFVVTFRLTAESVTSLIPIVVVGFILPYSEKWLSKLFKLNMN